MSAAAALAKLDVAGVRVRLLDDGTVRLTASGLPPPDVLALARAHRDGIAALLRGEAEPAHIGHHASVLPGVPPVWCEGVARLARLSSPPTIPPQRWAVLATTAARLLRLNGAELHAAGWTDVDLFGLHTAAPDRRMDAAGLAWLLHGRNVGAVTAETITIVAATGQELRYWRMGAQARQEAVPAWALFNATEAMVQDRLITSAPEDRT